LTDSRTAGLKKLEQRAGEKNKSEEQTQQLDQKLVPYRREKLAPRDELRN
jgi:hypothetical protein